MTTMRPRNSEISSENVVRPDFVRVGGRYRVGELLGSGGSGKPSSDSNLTSFLSSLGSVYRGKDIRTGAEVALKIGFSDEAPSRLSYEYNVYRALTGGTGISPVLWYGKETVYEIIVLEHLGTSLADLIHEQQFDRKKVFVYAAQMVR